MGSAITEPDAGSDVAAITTEARKDGSDYVINGNKTFITNGTVASYFNVICLTNPENPSRHRRHSVILVENDRPGFEANKLHHKIRNKGLRYSRIVTFQRMSVYHRKTLLVRRERDSNQFMKFFNITRIHVGARGGWHCPGCHGEGHCSRNE